MAPSPDPLAGLGISSTPPPAGPAKKKPIVGTFPADYVQPVGQPLTSHTRPDARTIGNYTIPGATQYGTDPLSQGTPGTTTTAGGTFYIDGQEWAPLNDPSSVPTLQAELVQAGLLTKANVRIGVWDATSAAAYKTALAFANSAGLQIKDALGVLIQNQKLGTAKSPSAQPGPFPLSNPEDDRAAFATAAQNLVGQKLPDDEAAKFAAYFQAQERGVNAQKIGDITGGAANYPNAPSVSTAAEDYIKKNDPAQVAAYGMASRMAEFQSMLGSAQGTL